MIELLRRRWKLVAVALVAILILPSFVSGVVGGGESIRLAANAPKKAEAMSLLVAIEPGLLGSCSGEAELEIEYQGIPVLPGHLQAIPVEGCEITTEIPYNEFARGNGQYLLRVTYDDHVVEERVFIEKYVNWVYVRAFDEKEQERTRIDVAFDILKAKPLTSSIFATGSLELTVRWTECLDDGLPEIPVVSENLSGPECDANGQLAFYGEIPVDNRASTHIYIPWDSLETKGDDGQAEEGWYNVTATFHNDAAKANYNVPQDPSVYQEDPPGNWFEVDRG